MKCYSSSDELYKPTADNENESYSILALFASCTYVLSFCKFLMTVLVIWRLILFYKQEELTQ